jgi:hypothetical protein
MVFESRVLKIFGAWGVGDMSRDLRRPDFGGTVPILSAVFHVLPGYMAGHTFVLLFETFGLH